MYNIWLWAVTASCPECLDQVTISARNWLFGILMNSLKKKKKWLKYSCLQSSVSSVQQSAWFYIYPLYLRFFPYIGHYPVLYSRSLLVTYFIYSSVHPSIPVSHFSPLPDPPRGNHKFVFYTCGFYFCFANKFICTIFHFPVLDR